MGDLVLGELVPSADVVVAVQGAVGPSGTAGVVLGRRGGAGVADGLVLDVFPPFV